MSATDELRSLLDEAGVEWGNIRNDGSESDYITEWQFDGIEGHAIATEWAVGNLTVCIAHPMTPEQAIAATVGRGTCHMETADGCQNWNSCSECGADYYTDQPINYCPNCGRKVVDE